MFPNISRRRSLLLLEREPFDVSSKQRITLLIPHMIFSILNWEKVAKNARMAISKAYRNKFLIKLDESCEIANFFLSVNRIQSLL